jgi:hypothetical protein
LLIQNTIILYVALYESETWSLAPKERTEKELSKRKVLRRVLGSKEEGKKQDDG